MPALVPGEAGGEEPTPFVQACQAADIGLLVEAVSLEVCSSLLCSAVLLVGLQVHTPGVDRDRMSSAPLKIVSQIVLFDEDGNETPFEQDYNDAENTSVFMGRRSA